MTSPLDVTQVACRAYGPPDPEEGVPHMCGDPEGHDGAHRCCCGFEWEAGGWLRLT